MSKKPKGMYEKCHGCNKWLTLDQVDKNYNKYKTAYCNECLDEVEREDDE